MNPIEQIWKELRKYFCNELFQTLDDVIDRLVYAINHLSRDTVYSITHRKWLSIV